MCGGAESKGRCSGREAPKSIVNLGGDEEKNDLISYQQQSDKRCKGRPSSFSKNVIQSSVTQQQINSVAEISSVSVVQSRCAVIENRTCSGFNYEVPAHCRSL